MPNRIILQPTKKGEVVTWIFQMVTLQWKTPTLENSMENVQMSFGWITFQFLILQWEFFPRLPRKQWDRKIYRSIGGFGVLPVEWFPWIPQVRPPSWGLPRVYSPYSLRIPGLPGAFLVCTLRILSVFLAFLGPSSCVLSVFSPHSWPSWGLPRVYSLYSLRIPGLPGAFLVCTLRILSV